MSEGRKPMGRGPGGRGPGGRAGGRGFGGRGPGGFKRGEGAPRRGGFPRDKETNDDNETSTPVLSRAEEQKQAALRDWNPKTEAGRLVKEGEITSMEDLWARNLPILEEQIVDMLVPDLMDKLIDTRKTAYVRSSGRKFNFSAFILVGDGKKYIGLGIGSDKERYPAVRKATRNAKLNLMPVRTGSGSWEDFSDTTRSVPFKVTGRAGSVRVTLHPAPRGTGLVVGQQIQDVFRFAGITDVWGQTRGSSDTKLNFVRAAYNALQRVNETRVSPDVERKFSKRGGNNS